MNARVIFGFAVISLAAQGCSPRPPVQAAAMPLHYGPPPARLCKLSPFALAEGASTPVQMTVSNDGGYCAIMVAQKAGGAFDAGLEPVQPSHGTALIIKYNNQTSIEYVPEPRHLGTDAFTVRLIVRGQPGYTTLPVAVTITDAEPNPSSAVPSAA